MLLSIVFIQSPRHPRCFRPQLTLVFPSLLLLQPAWQFVTLSHRSPTTSAPKICPLSQLSCASSPVLLWSCHSQELQKSLFQHCQAPAATSNLSRTSALPPLLITRDHHCANSTESHISQPGTYHIFVSSFDALI